MIAEILKTRPKTDLSQRRAGIISGILVDGFQPACRLRRKNITYVPSVDRRMSTDVQGNLLVPGSSHADIIWLLYPTTSSVFPVVVERRSGEKWPETSEVASSRAQSSFLVVAPADKLKEKDPNYISDMSDAGGGLGFPNGVNPADFTHWVFPRNIWDCLDGIQVPGAAHVVLVDNIRRYLYRRDKVSALVLDYESILRQLARSTKEPYWVHIARLPIPEDL